MKRKRERIAEGIYRDQFGIAVCVRRGAKQIEKRYPKSTAMRTLKEARMAMQLSLKGTPAKHGLSRSSITPWARECYIYFVEDAGANAIKIGRASDVKSRFCSLQGSTPHPLRLLGSIAAYDIAERRMHEKFAHLRITREWFRGDLELREAIGRWLEGSEEL